MKLIGIDYGEKHIGLALGDTDGKTAVPWETIDAAARPVDFIEEMVRGHGAEKVVVGLPIRLDGNEGPVAVRVRLFVKDLEARLRVPVETMDERMTSKLADRMKNVYGKQFDRDALAAAEILQSYLDRV